MSGVVVDILASAIWGFLVGFVGWGSLFRLAQPDADWLTEKRGDGPAAGIARSIVTLFLTVAVLFALALIPILLVASGKTNDAIGEGDNWRSMFGIAFVSSL